MIVSDKVVKVLASESLGCVVMPSEETPTENEPDSGGDKVGDSGAVGDVDDEDEERNAAAPDSECERYESAGVVLETSALVFSSDTKCWRESSASSAVAAELDER